MRGILERDLKESIRRIEEGSDPLMRRQSSTSIDHQQHPLVMFNLRADTKDGKLNAHHFRGALKRWRYDSSAIFDIMKGYPDGQMLNESDLDVIKKRVYDRMVAWTGPGEEKYWTQLLTKLLEHEASYVDASVLHGGFSGRCVLLKGWRLGCLTDDPSLLSVAFSLFIALTSPSTNSTPSASRLACRAIW